MGELESFAALLACGDVRIELARVCLMLAADAYPDLDVERYLGDLERLAMRLRRRLPQTAGAEDKLIALNRFLFDDLGYQGNAADYYDPRNSYLNEVMDRRTGIPITLSILYMEVGRRIGLPLEGVSFPGHFLVRLRLRAQMLVLDPFDGGAARSAQELRERLARVVPAGATGGLAVSELPLEQFLEPASHRQIVVRVLRNLKGIYLETDRPERLLQVLNRLVVVAPEASAELRDRGYAYERLECWRPALQDLSEYVAREPDAPDREVVHAKVVQLKELCARLN
jgi:regulator of sirC expression with transglutaminase-like and TPR domain